MLSEELNLPRDNQCPQRTSIPTGQSELSHPIILPKTTRLVVILTIQGKGLPQNSTEETNTYVKYILTFEIVGSMKEP